MRRALVRARVHEPARFFGYGLGLAPLLLCVLFAAAINGAWVAGAFVAAPLCVFWFAAIECIRLSVFSPATHITTLIRTGVRTPVDGPALPIGRP